MKFILGRQINIEVFYKLITPFWVCKPGMPKVPKIKSVHIFAKAWWMKLVFCLQINTEIFYKLIVSIWVCMFVCVLFPFTVKASLLIEQNNKCNARVQVSYVMLRKWFCAKYLCCHIIDNHSRDLQASNCVKECQTVKRVLNQAKLWELKDNILKISQNQQ